MKARGRRDAPVFVSLDSAYICLTLLNSVVTLCTTRLNIQKFYVLSAECMYVFAGISE